MKNQFSFAVKGGEILYNGNILMKTKLLRKDPRSFDRVISDIFLNRHTTTSKVQISLEIQDKFFQVEEFINKILEPYPDLLAKLKKRPLAIKPTAYFYEHPK